MPLWTDEGWGVSCTKQDGDRCDEMLKGSSPGDPLSGLVRQGDEVRRPVRPGQCVDTGPDAVSVAHGSVCDVGHVLIWLGAPDAARQVIDDLVTTADTIER